MARTVDSYSRTQKFLHWAIVVLIALQYLGGDFISEFEQRVRSGALNAGDVPVLAQAHVVLGILTLVLVLWRIALILWRGKPAAPEGEDPRLKMVAHATHGFLYLLLLLVPASGMIGWFGAVSLAVDVHNLLTTLLGLLVILHIAAALFHQLVLRNNLMARNMPKPVMDLLAPVFERISGIISDIRGKKT